MRTWLAQNLTSTMIDLPLTNRRQKVTHRLLQYVRKAILLITDPLIYYNIRGIQIEMPFSHTLPHFQKSHPNYSMNLGRVSEIISRKYKTISVIDIGANVGDSAAIISSYVSCPILCIEGEEYFWSILSKNSQKMPNVSVCKCLVGTENTKKRGYLQKIGGNAIIKLTNNDSGGEILEFKTLKSIVAEYSNFAAPRLIKLDVEGFDVPILLSSMDFLREHKCIVFCEFKPYQFEAICAEAKSFFASMKTIGYNYVLFWQNTGEFVLGSHLGNLDILDDMYKYFYGDGSYPYADICLLHNEDQDLFELIRNEEKHYFKSVRHSHRMV